MRLEELKLEKVSEENFVDIFDIFKSKVLTRYFTSGADETLKDSKNRTEKLIKHWNRYGFGDFIVKDFKTDKVIGFCGLHYKKAGGKVNISYIVHEELQRKGYATRICRRLLKYGFEEVGLKEIVAEIDPLNKNSIKLIEKEGFVFNRKITWNGIDRMEYVMKKES